MYLSMFTFYLELLIKISDNVVILNTEFYIFLVLKDVFDNKGSSKSFRTNNNTKSINNACRRRHSNARSKPEWPTHYLTKTRSVRRCDDRNVLLMLCGNNMLQTAHFLLVSWLST